MKTILFALAVALAHFTASSTLLDSWTGLSIHRKAVTNRWLRWRWMVFCNWFLGALLLLMTPIIVIIWLIAFCLLVPMP